MIQCNPLLGSIPNSAQGGLLESCNTAKSSLIFIFIESANVYFVKVRTCGYDWQKDMMSATVDSSFRPNT